MSIITSARMSPIEQIGQLFSSLGALFTHALESTETAFQRVVVQKKDNEGKIKFYKQITNDPNVADNPVSKIVCQLPYIEDIKTGAMYKDEPMHVVAVKCTLIAIVMPFYTIGKMAWYAVKTAVEVAVVAGDAIVSSIKYLSREKACKAFITLKEGLTEAALTLAYGIYDFVKSPLFMLGCQIAALYGILKPYHGRKYEALIENAWQNGASYREDKHKFPARTGEFSWKDFKTDLHNATPSYLAQCFQVRGNVKEPHVTVIRREPEYSLFTHLRNHLASS